MKVLNEVLLLKVTSPLPDRGAHHATCEKRADKGYFKGEAKLHRSILAFMEVGEQGSDLVLSCWI
jgi:hypothetical protein